MNDTPTEEISKEIREYYKTIGARGGETNKKKGSEYFRWVRSHNKTRPTLPPKESTQ